MAELTDEHKTAIVLELARFRGPAEVAVKMKEEFGLDLIVQQIVKYDPTRPAFEAGERWRVLFDLGRKEFIENISAIPVANQSYRLEILQRGIQDAISRKKWTTAATLAAQAAQEIGGSFTNQRHVAIDNRGRARDLTAEERKEAFISLIEEAMQKRKEAGPPAITLQ